MSVASSPIYSTRYRQLIREFPLRRIRTKSDAAAATKILDASFRDEYADAGEAEYIYVLAGLLEEYEKKHDPASSEASGVDVLRHLMDEHKLTQADVGNILGISQSAVSMLLSGERAMTTEHARKLGQKFGINPGAFI